jgi:hypothetical protein
MGEDLKEMAAILEAAMYGRKPFKPGDLVVYRPKEDKRSRIKNLTPGNVYSIVDVPGFKFEPGCALPIVNDKGLENWYRQDHFEHHSELKGIGEIVKAFEPLKGLAEFRTMQFTITSADIDRGFIFLEGATAIMNATNNGITLVNSPAGDFELKDQEFRFLNDGFSPGDILMINYGYWPGEIKTKKTRRDMHRETIKKREQEEQVARDFMEELKGL